MAESDRRGVLIGGIASSSSLGENGSVLEEDGVLRCCLKVFVPSALVMVVTVEYAGPKVVSILVILVLSAVGMFVAPAEKRL